MNRHGGHMGVGRFIAAAAAGLVVALLAVQQAGAVVPPDETFQGATGGGTITITLTENRTRVRRIELDNVTYQPAPQDGCGATVTVVRHFDPAVAVTSGSFNATLIPVDSGVMAVDLVSAGGQFGGNTITGSTAFSASNGLPEQGCFSQGLPYTAMGPVDTPPTVNDTRFAGSVDGYSGLLEFHIDGDGIASIGFDAVTGPCGATSSPVDARDFYETSLAQAPGTGAFSTDIQFSSTDFSALRRITIDGVQPDADTLTGTMTVTTFVPSCTQSANWTAVRTAGVGGFSELITSVDSGGGHGRTPMGVATGVVALLLALLAVHFARLSATRRRAAPPGTA